MRVYLTKQNRKTTDFILLESDDKFVRKSTGKIGKSGIGNLTFNAGSEEKANKVIDKQVKEYELQGFCITDLPNDFITKDEVFDKAKWHINEKFPDNLDHYQSYIHTGYFVTWLIQNDLYEKDFKNDHIKSIQDNLARKTTPGKFYELELDGVFDAEGLTQEAIRFTKDYFDFEKGNYINDYVAILAPNGEFPSIFHITDNWTNYDKLKTILNNRFSEWKIKINNR